MSELPESNRHSAALSRSSRCCQPPAMCVMSDITVACPSPYFSVSLLVHPSVPASPSFRPSLRKPVRLRKSVRISLIVRPFRKSVLPSVSVSSIVSVSPSFCPLVPSVHLLPSVPRPFVRPVRLRKTVRPVCLCKSVRLPKSFLPSARPVRPSIRPSVRVSVPSCPVPSVLSPPVPSRPVPLMTRNVGGAASDPGMPPPDRRLSSHRTSS